MFDLSSSPLWLNLFVFFAAAAAIGISGTRLAGFADRLADRTGLGEAVAGTVFLGVTTSLAGISASVTAALEGHPALAISNALGGIAVQAAFLAVADLFYPKANLEHAAASVANMILAAILVMTLSLVLLGLVGPEVSVGHVNPVTFVIFLAWIGGFLLVYRSRLEPMWTPKATAETVRDVPDETYRHEHLGRLLVGFSMAAVVVAISGAAVAHTTGNLSEQTGLNESLAGGVLTAVATSLPELVTTIASVRRGAMTLAVSDIVGGNSFDVLFICAADLVYFKGSLYHGEGVGDREQFLAALTICINTVLMLGLLYRQRSGPANIGFESVLMLLLYGGGITVLTLM